MSLDLVLGVLLLVPGLLVLFAIVSIARFVVARVRTACARRADGSSPRPTRMPALWIGYPPTPPAT